MYNQWIPTDSSDSNPRIGHPQSLDPDPQSIGQIRQIADFDPTHEEPYFKYVTKANRTTIYMYILQIVTNSLAFLPM